LALILPAESEAEIIALAATEGLSLVRVTRVYSKVSKPARRVLLQFVRSESREYELTPIEDQLVLEDDQGGRSEAYRELTKDFYL
jgi:tRNA1(Val) A37 N6-methylase TrmN6